MRYIVSLFCFALIASGASAGEEPAALPKDGTWIRYTVTSRKDAVEESRTYALVGTKIDSGRVCRWVEIRQVFASPQGERVVVLKFLVPEKDLLENDRPLEGLVRSWRKSDDEPAEATRDAVLAPGYLFARMFMIFPGVQKKAQSIDEPRTVDYQTGQFKIPNGRSGQVVTTRKAATAAETQTLRQDFRVWFDPAVPLGPAEWQEDLTLLRDDNPSSPVQSTFVIQDFGTDAKTALPDND